ncbi:MAG: aspartate 1-decarboxylase [Actinomycetota bacterium]|nr:aspartate 1-decarboxylase [Actinomycetota bacterium]
MLTCVLKSKIHRPVVTDAEIDYMGSITIDKSLMEHAKILPYEKVMVVSIDSGERLETYAIEGDKDSGVICTNGAAARKILKGEKIIIFSFAYMGEKEIGEHRPRIVYVDEKNRITGEKDHVEKNDQC